MQQYPFSMSTLLSTGHVRLPIKAYWPILVTDQCLNTVTMVHRSHLPNGTTNKTDIWRCSREGCQNVIFLGAMYIGKCHIRDRSLKISGGGSVVFQNDADKILRPPLNRRAEIQYVAQFILQHIKYVGNNDIQSRSFVVCIGYWCENFTRCIFVRFSLKCCVGFPLLRGSCCPLLLCCLRVALSLFPRNVTWGEGSANTGCDMADCFSDSWEDFSKGWNYSINGWRGYRALT